MPANGRALKAELGSRAKLVELPNAGHALLFEQPDRVTAEVLAFVKSQ
jgi:pimeloyl-ACP methyl ester carboxylesterase